jgi:uncharacterized protein YlbG (UPF0298 family)
MYMYICMYVYVCMYVMDRKICQTVRSLTKFTIVNKVSQATCFDPPLG